MLQETKISMAIVLKAGLLRKGLSLLLEGLEYPAVSVTSAATVEELLGNNPVPQILLQCTKGNNNADILESINQFKLRYPGVHLLALLVEFNEGLMKQLKQSSASGYLFIDAAPADFKKAIKQVMKGHRYYQQSPFLQDDSINLSDIIHSFFP